MAATSIDPHRATQLAAELSGLAADLATQYAAGPLPDPELMNGTAGAALALHSAGIGSSASCWDALLSLV